MLVCRFAEHGLVVSRFALEPGQHDYIPCLATYSVCNLRPQFSVEGGEKYISDLAELQQGLGITYSKHPGEWPATGA